MRADLLEAKAAIDWAKSQSDIVVRRIGEWIESGPYQVVPEIDSQTGEQLFKAKAIHKLPLEFNAGVGAIVNMFRSSLDLIASVLHTRHRITTVKIDDVYFPIAKSAAVFASGRGYKGHKFVKALPLREQTIIENLKPYTGGDDLLYALHKMDITRKHRALLGVSHPMRSVGAMRWGGIDPDLKIVWVRDSLENDAVIAHAPRGSYHKLTLRVDVTFRDAHTLTGKPVGGGLRDFARLTQSILKDFDF